MLHKMSNIIASFASLLLLLSTFCGNAVDDAVLDTNGRPLRSHSMYYILPADQGQGGGLTMSLMNRTSICPLYVTQERHEVYPGLPVWFLPSDSSQRVISLSSDVNILFNIASICFQSAGWQVTTDHTSMRRYVATGGAIGNPGEETVSSWFKIEKVGSSSDEDDYRYKIVFCPTVCTFCMVMCGDVGVYVQEDGTRVLGLFQHPLRVIFKKAKLRET